MATVTKKITQLQPITDAELTSEAILPVVVSDPLSPNRQAKTSQVLRCASAGSKAAPGIAFSLNRSTGLYQSAANELGVAFWIEDKLTSNIWLESLFICSAACFLIFSISKGEAIILF